MEHLRKKKTVKKINSSRNKKVTNALQQNCNYIIENTTYYPDLTNLKIYQMGIYRDTEIIDMDNKSVAAKDHRYK